MPAKRRQPQYLAFKGWMGDGSELLVQARLCVKTSKATWVETGPLLMLSIPAHRLLDETVTNAAHWAQHQAEVAEHIAAIARDADNQPPLFE